MQFLQKYFFTILIALIIIFIVIFEKSISLNTKILAFTVSYILKEIFMFIIPIFIFPIIVKSIIEISSSSSSILILIVIIIFVFISNFISIVLAYVVGIETIPYLGVMREMEKYKTYETIYSMLRLNIISLDIIKTTIVAVFTGFVLSYIRCKFLIKTIEFYHRISKFFLSKIFIFFIPLYILGTFFKVINEIDFFSVIYFFGKIIILIFFVQCIYIFLLFLIGSGFTIKKCFLLIKNTLPAFFIGFSTMSSLLTLPTTLQVVEHNTKNCSFAKLTTSATVNCHDIGDCIALPLISITILYYITGLFPTLDNYLMFAFFAAITQFSAASIPGGSIVVLLPILEKYLGFTEDMGILIIALSICIEPIGTAMNIAGNSAFSIIMSKLFKNYKKLSTKDLK